MVRMVWGLEQGGSVAGGCLNRVFWGNWVIMGSDGTSIGHKRQVIHKKLGVLAQIFLFVPPALGRRERWQ